MVLPIILIVWFFVSSVYYWGAMTFKKYACLKAVLCWIIFMLLLVPVFYCIVSLIFGQVPVFYFPFAGMRFEGLQEIIILSYYPYLLFRVGVFVSIALLIISRVKFNEKTI